MRWCKLLIALFLVAASTLSLAQEQSNLEPLEQFPHTALMIATPDARVHHFDVWVADTGNRQSQGLMFVKSMPSEKGMLFLYAVPHSITMWMKNTLLSLDMVFIRADGRVASIAERTKPMSTKLIESKENVVAVLELNAGTAARLGIRPGAIVMHSAFGTASGQ